MTEHPMADRDYSDYQKKIIRRFYDNRDQNDEQQLADLASNLYLSSGKKLAKLWEQARGILERMRVPKSRIDHVMNSQNPALVAEIVKEVEAGTLKRDAKPAT
jgi:hypothetical protein